MAFVSYTRQAFVNRFGPPLRITFDTALACAPGSPYTPRLWAPEQRLLPVRTVPVVLEVKFRERMPDWLQRALRQFELDMGMITPQTADVSEQQKDLGPAQTELN